MTYNDDPYRWYYDRQGNPITAEQWGKLIGEGNRVARGEVTFRGVRVEVSTVWLGLNHQFGDGPPQIFETMIFGKVPFDQDLVRYSTEQQALDGHRRTMDALADGRLPDWVCE